MTMNKIITVQCHGSEHIRCVLSYQFAYLIHCLSKLYKAAPVLMKQVRFHKSVCKSKLTPVNTKHAEKQSH